MKGGMPTERFMIDDYFKLRWIELCRAIGLGLTGLVISSYSRLVTRLEVMHVIYQLVQVTWSQIILEERQFHGILESWDVFLYEYSYFFS